MLLKEEIKILCCLTSAQAFPKSGVDSDFTSHPSGFICFLTNCHVSLLQVRCFTPPSQADCLCPQRQIAAFLSEDSWPQSGSCIWPGRPVWTAVHLDGWLTAASATQWLGHAQTVEGVNPVSAPSHRIRPLTTARHCTTLTATEVLFRNLSLNKDQNHGI